MIPSSLQDIFKTFTVTSATKGGSQNPGTTDQAGKLALLAEKEIFGAKSYSCQDEFNSSKVHSQLEWFKTASNRLKKRSGGSSFERWTERSPSYENYSGDTPNFCAVNGGNTPSATSAEADWAELTAPFGVI